MGAAHRTLGILVAIAVCGIAARAEADPEACAQAYEAAQERRAEGKLIDARRNVVECAQDACPSVIRKDCVRWLSQIDDEIPSVAVRVHGIDGCDRADAIVAVDGAHVPNGADGRAISVDPGKHSIRATIDAASVEQVIVVADGERRRLVTIELGERGAVCRDTRARVPASAVTSEAPKTVPVPAYLLGGIGLVGLGLFTGFGISAWSQKGTLDECRGTCAQRDVDVMERTFIVADIAGIVALTSLVAAAAVYLAR